METILEKLVHKKEKLDGMRPLPAAQLRNLEEWYTIELTYTSNAIEGNTLTRAETALVVEKGITVKGKTLVEHLEAKNHVVALEYVKGLVNKKRLDEDDILKIHALILQGIDDPSAGRYRNIPVRIAGSPVIMPNYMKVPTLMSEFSRWLRGKNSMNPVRRAAEAHYRLVSIHPFTDGNGRTSRLLMNLLLMQAGYPPAIIRPEDRHDYIAALEKAQLGGAIDDFYEVIYTAVDRSLDVYLGVEQGKEVQVAPVEENDRINRMELADLVGVRPTTVRYYTEEGLLSFAQEAEGLRRYYDRDTSVRQLQQILALRKKGMSIEEIKKRLQ
jgi:Fic family protein